MAYSSRLIGLVGVSDYRNCASMAGSTKVHTSRGAKVSRDKLELSRPKFLLDEEINLLNLCEIKLKRISFSGYKSNN